MKLKKKLMLLEDFGTKTTQTTNATATNNATEVKTEVKTGEKIRTEVLSDVDAILTNLETLSSQITEEVDELLENTDWYASSLNESFMDEMIKTFKSIRAFARLQSSWPKMYQDKLDLEIQNVRELGSFESKVGEKEEAMTAAIKQKFDAKKKEITASDMPTEKKKAARVQVDQVYKDSEAKIKEKIKKQIDTKKAVIVNKQKQSGDKLTAEMSEFEADNKIESDLIQKRWSLIKTNKQNQMDNAHIEAKGEAELEFMDADNPEAIKKAQERMKKQIADMKAEDAAALKQKEEDLKAAETEAEARAQEGSEDEKEANNKILTFYKTGNALRGALQSQKPEDYDDAAKLEIKKLKTAFNDAKDKVTGSVFVTGKVAEDATEGEEIANGLKDDIKEMLADFKAVLDAAGESKSDLEKATEAAKTAVDTAQENLDTEELTEDPAKIKTAKINLLDAKIAHETAKKAEAADKGEDTAKFDEKIAEHEQAKTLLDTGGTDDQTRSAEDVATEELGDAKADYTKIDDPEEKEPDTTDADGNTVPGRNKWTDIKRFKGKDAEGADTAEEVIYAKPNDSQSAATVAGIKLNEGMTVAEKFAILMNR
jgi:hypothetical protein